MRFQKRWLYAGCLLLMLAAPMSALAETSSEVIYHSGPASLESNPQEASSKPAPTGKTLHGNQPDPQTEHVVAPTTGREPRAETTPESESEPGSKDHRAHPATARGDGGHPPGDSGPKE